MSKTQVVDIPLPVEEAPAAKPARRRRDAPTAVSLEVAKRVSRMAQDSENQFDKALVAVGNYALMLPAMRGETSLPFGAAQPAVNDAIQALAKMSEARELLRSAHAHLSQLAKDAGLETIGFGPIIWKSWKAGGDTQA